MLTPSDLHNIKNFDQLKYNHQKVFRYRIRRKCRSVFRDLQYILLNYKKLRIINPEKLFDPTDLIDFLQLYEDIKKMHRKV